ncbi:hypothetical protein CDAR_81911 [Caerostris darwini]|uniref:Uncharacterized protein n=1 Tax=Caerostris darwini TaxID=1538125 RepID=A0AAV4V6N0_9ARAC|nr:hypothetical protein CDAR_81911 [Caerostris darwini]
MLLSITVHLNTMIPSPLKISLAIHYKDLLRMRVHTVQYACVIQLITGLFKPGPLQSCDIFTRLQGVSKQTKLARVQRCREEDKQHRPSLTRR